MVLVFLLPSLLLLIQYCDVVAIIDRDFEARRWYTGLTLLLVVYIIAIEHVLRPSLIWFHVSQILVLHFIQQKNILGNTAEEGLLH